MAASPQLETQIVRHHAGLAEVQRPWAELHAAARPGSAFQHPAWASTWADHFVPSGRLFSILVWTRSRELVGVAPMYLRRWWPPFGPTVVQPLGTGYHRTLTEHVQLLARKDHHASAVKSILSRLQQESEYDWIQLSLGASQGWLVPQWVATVPHWTLHHRSTKAAVVWRNMPTEPDQLRASLKRNVKESIRRATNRTKKLSTFVTVTIEAGEPQRMSEGLDHLRRLHAARAAWREGARHRNHLTVEADWGFICSAVARLADQGLARLHIAEVDGQAVAALLVLSDGTCDYMSISGLDPRFWDYSLNTLLVWQALRTCIERGRKDFNFSTGPDIAKLRWSEELDFVHDFAVVKSSKMAQMRFGAYTQAELLVRHRGERLFF